MGGGFRDFFWRADGDGSLRIGNSLFTLIAFVFVVLPGLLNFFDFDGLQSLLTTVFWFATPEMPEFSILGKENTPVSNHIRNIVAIILYYFVIISTIFIYLFSWARSSIRERIEKDFSLLKASVDSDRHLVSSGLNEIKNRLDSSAKSQKISFAIFDQLLIYSPLYIAEGANYFAEEGISAEFSVSGDDKQVAQSVRNGDHLFGACDPFVCVPNSKSAQEKDDDLLILFPLVKRYGFLVFGHTELAERLDRGRIKVGAYEEGSTSHLVAKAFKTELAKKYARAKSMRIEDAEERIEIEEISVLSSGLNNEDSLAITLEQFDAVVLWEPQSSWVLNSKIDLLTNFGVVAIASTSAPQSEVLKVIRKQPAGASGVLDKGWNAWTPAGSHKCLISAVVTTRATLRDRPTLCRRVHRALARSSIHMHSVDFTLDEKILKSVKDHLKDATGIDPFMLQRMIRGDPASGSKAKASERGGLFPFVYGLPGTKPAYSAHLKACHDLWHNNGGVGHPSWAEKDYYRCFVRFEDLKNTANAQ